jgi:hypothetical protein
MKMYKVRFHLAKGVNFMKWQITGDIKSPDKLGKSEPFYVDPDEVLGVIKQKLSHFGFDFEMKNSLNDGDNLFQLVQYGSPQLGVYGQNPYDDVNKMGFKQGDGIKEKIGHSLDLLVNIQRGSNMLRKLTVMIIPADPSSIRDVDNGAIPDCGCNH